MRSRSIWRIADDAGDTDYADFRELNAKPAFNVKKGFDPAGSRHGCTKSNPIPNRESAKPLQVRSLVLLTTLN